MNKLLKRFLLIVVFLGSVRVGQSQDYFEGANLYCESKNPEALKHFRNGIELLKLTSGTPSKYLTTVQNLFFKALQLDTAFCDACFFVGYTLRLEEKNNLAWKYYALADILAKGSALEFKLNLASVSLILGNEKFAREKYEEMMAAFPGSPEGYYGIGLTAPALGDYENGLKNINIAFQKYQDSGHPVKTNGMLLKGILLSLCKKHDEAVSQFEVVYSEYKKIEKLNLYYSWSLFNVAQRTGDEKMKKKAKKLFEKIEHKEDIPPEIREQMIF